MPTKTTDAGREYECDGKKFVWHPLDDDDQPGNLAPVTIPMRIKMGVLRSLEGQSMDADTMFKMLGKLIPGQADAMDEMDINDFMAMFNTWQAEYNLLAGASLGESSGSSA